MTANAVEPSGEPTPGWSDGVRVTSSAREVAKRAVRVGVISVFVGGLLAAGAIRCPVAMVARIPCPGCGLSRASLALLHGHVAEALAFHPLVVIILPLLAAFFGVNTIVYLRTGDWGWVDRRMGRGMTITALLLAVLTVGVWLARFFGAFGGPVPV